MPGKQVGMSDTCYPDRLINTIPNLYVFLFLFLFLFLFPPTFSPRLSLTHLLILTCLFIISSSYSPTHPPTSSHPQVLLCGQQPL